MVNRPWHPRGNAYPVVWALSAGPHADEHGVIVRIRIGPAEFEYELYDQLGKLVGTYATGSEASEVGWDLYLAANSARHDLAARRKPEGGPHVWRPAAPAE